MELYENIQKLDINIIKRLNEEKKKQGIDNDGFHVEANMVQ